MNMTIRRYGAEDREACVALFVKNTPEWFAPHEREQYEAFLDEAPGTYFVMLDEGGGLAGAGGVEVEAGRRVGWLTWGLVDPARHGQGLGRTLLEYRLELLREDASVDRVCIDTSQLTAPFYEKFGFTAQRIIPDGYAKGLDRHEMELRLTA